MLSQVKQWGVAALAVVVVMGVVILAVRANADHGVSVDESAIAKAKARHERASRSAKPPRRPTAPPARTTAKQAEQPVRSRPDLDTRDDMWATAKKGPGIPQPELRPVGKVTLTPGTETFVLAMDGANKLYDRGDYIGALEAAEELLEQQPNNVRMLRIAVSSHCLLGNQDEAVDAWQRLPQRDQRQMAARCSRYGIEFEETD